MSWVEKDLKINNQGGMIIRDSRVYAIQNQENKSKVNANTQRTKLKFNILFRILSAFKLSINFRKHAINYFSWENYLLLNLQEFVFIRYDFDLMIIMNDLLNLLDSCWLLVAPSLLFYLFKQHTLFQKYNDYKDTQILTKEACIKH